MTEYVCRVAVVGAQRPRVAKVASMLQNTLVQQNEHVNITVEYLPCIAAFGAYKNDTGAVVKYLANLSLCIDGTSSSLAPLLDEERDEADPFPGIAAVAIGIGIEDESDIQQIKTFLRTLAGERFERILVDCVKPNPEYTSMKEETMAYQALDALQKEEVTNLQTIGPGKMANFAESLAHQTIEIAYPKPIIEESTPKIETSPEPTSKKEPLPEFDATKTRYACRMCRVVLFGQDDLESHEPYQQGFGWRKTGSAKCESVFLAEGLVWIGDISAVEGRFGCPLCSTKLGIWNWAGTQCSCGTWVVPAIQVPLSKVDVLPPVIVPALTVEEFKEVEDPLL